MLNCLYEFIPASINNSNATICSTTSWTEWQLVGSRNVAVCAVLCFVYVRVECCCNAKPCQPPAVVLNFANVMFSAAIFSLAYAFGPSELC